MTRMSFLVVMLVACFASTPWAAEDECCRASLKGRQFRGTVVGKGDDLALARKDALATAQTTICTSQVNPHCGTNTCENTVKKMACKGYAELSEDPVHKSTLDCRLTDNRDEFCNTPGNEMKACTCTIKSYINCMCQCKAVGPQEPVIE
jgi:hypothetical protein